MPSAFVGKLDQARLVEVGDVRVAQASNAAEFDAAIATLIADRRNPARCVNDFRSACHQLVSKSRQARKLIVGLDPVGGDVLAFDPAELAHLVEEGFDGDGRFGPGGGREHIDAAHVARLRRHPRHVAAEAGAEREHEKSSLVHSISSSAHTGHAAACGRAASAMFENYPFACSPASFRAPSRRCNTGPRGTTQIAL